jgi:hypothetical protein
MVESYNVNGKQTLTHAMICFFRCR